MGKHANRKVWEIYDSWRTREPDDDEPRQPPEFDEDVARMRMNDAAESGRRVGRVRLFDEV